jgi:putative ABC transport system permease protein
MRRFILRLLNAVRPSAAEDELAREVSAHLALLEEEHRRRGSSVEEAALAARRAIGNVAQVQDAHRDARSFAWIDDLRRDTRQAARRLRQAPGFTAVAVLTLGAGIGVNNTFFTIVNAICLRGLPIEAPERVLLLGTRDSRGRPSSMSYAEFDALQAAQRSFSGVAAYTNAPVTIADEGRAADRVMGAHISAAGFDLLGEVPILGRGFRLEDDRAGAPAVVVIGSGVWKTRYGADPDIIGRTILVSGLPANVIGVMRDQFRFLQNTEVWQPLGTMAGLSGQPRDARTLFVFGRVAPQARVEEAIADVEALGDVWAGEFPESNRGVSTRAVPINEALNGNLNDPTWFAFITAGALVLLIACANVANLLLMRGAVRGREIAIRASIGATRGRLVRQLLIESALLAGLAAVAGVALSLMGLRLLSNMVPSGALQYWMTLTIDGRVLAVLLSVTIVSIFIFGLAPALHLLRVDVNQIIKDSGRLGTAGVPARRWTTAFLAVEFALTLVLLAIVIGGVRQQWVNQRSEFQLDSVPLMSMWVTLPGQSYSSPESRAAFYDAVAGRFASIPGVASVAIASNLPRVGAAPMQLEIAGSESPADGALPTIVMVGTGENYFETLAMPLVRGRTFTGLDGSPGQEAAIVNQRLVDMFFGERDPVGQLIRVARAGSTVSGAWSRIVGVAPTIRQRPFGSSPDPVVYLPHRSSPSATAAIVVRATGEPTSLAPAIREELRRLDRNLPLYRVMPLQQAIDESGWNGRMAAVVAQNIAMIALLMALVGLYAVTAHTVHWWRPELGLRIALGAPPRGVAWMVLRQALARLAIGLVVGTTGTYAFDRAFTVVADPADPVRLTDTGALLSLMGLIAIAAIAACAIPVRRAIRVDPVVALRAE